MILDWKVIMTFQNAQPSTVYYQQSYSSQKLKKKSDLVENSRNNDLEPRLSARSNKGVPPDCYDAEQVDVAKGPYHKKDPKCIKKALSGPKKDH